MKQVWEAINGDIFDTQKECIDFERSLFEEREDAVKMFYKALSLMDDACRQTGCDCCPIHSMCDQFNAMGTWTDFIDENALPVINRED